MIGNKWVQSSTVFGIGVGIWLGGWMAMISPVAFLSMPIPTLIVAAGILDKARGTDGWGGPYNGK